MNLIQAPLVRPAVNALQQLGDRPAVQTALRYIQGLPGALFLIAMALWLLFQGIPATS